jgi:hypothetical protein
MSEQDSDWRLLKSELDRARPRFLFHLEKFFESLSAEWKEKLKVQVTEYYYGEKLAVDGWPLWPRNAPVLPEYLVAHNFPLGVITENACEISEYTGERTSKLAPEAILIPGDFIGLFEAVDFLSRVPNPPIPKWNISAGACSIYALKNLATQQNRARLGKALRQHVSIADTDLLTQLKSLDIFDQIGKNWKVRVIWFSKGWIEALRLHYAGTEANRLIEYLTRRAWKNLARIRDKDPVPLQKALREATNAKGKRVEITELAGVLIKRANDVLLGRQPCYMPVKTDNELGPFRNICEMILSHVSSENWILCPRYLLKDDKVGYMRLDHVIPTIFSSRNGHGIKGKIIEMMSVLATASRNKIPERRFSEEMFSHMKSINNIIFQTPGSASFSEGGDSKPSIYKITLDVSARADDVAKLHFYQPLFNVMPTERCAFFRSSMRIERLEDSAY